MLAQAIRRGGYDLVWAGHLSVDNGAGQVAIRTAELLGWPHAGAVVACRVGEGGSLHVVRDAEGDSESWELALPALLTAQQGLNEPRYPALAGIMKAKRKPVNELAPEELLAGADVAPRTERLGCDAPPDRPEGRKLGGTAREQATKLVALLRNEAQVLKEE
jgi:electron transfer flavoprotein beta subunit